MINDFLFLYAGLTTERDTENSARFAEESSPKKSSSLVMVEGRADKVMENYPIIVDKVSIPKKTIAGVRTPIKK